MPQNEGSKTNLKFGTFERQSSAALWPAFLSRFLLQKQTMLSTKQARGRHTSIEHVWPGHRVRVRIQLSPIIVRRAPRRLVV